MTDLDLKKFITNLFFSGDSILTNDKGSLNIDNGSMIGTHGELLTLPLKNQFSLVLLVDSLMNFHFNNYQIESLSIK